jgi:hypothetical protein
MRHDSVLSRPAKKTRPNLFATVFRRLLSFPIRGYAGAALTAVLTGIVVNALTLQHARHPAPFFAPHPVALAAPAAPPAPVVPAPMPSPAAAKPAEPAPASVLPPQRPTGLGAGAAPAATRHADEIGDILREETAKDGEKEILAAQNALIKIGYTLHADGVANSATLAALRDFERTHSLPISTDVTPRLLRHLAVAAAAGH